MDELKTVKIAIPGWAAAIYIIISLAMIPWTIALGFHLPTQHLSKNWDVTWVGLDIGLILSLLTTGFLAKINSIYMVLAASVTGTLFLADAWFDILGYRMGSLGFAQAIFTAALGELPMALMSFGLAVHGLHRMHRQRNLKQS
jgi:nucleoside recognition membrane protein YjiH